MWHSKQHCKKDLHVESEIRDMFTSPLTVCVCVVSTSKHRHGRKLASTCTFPYANVEAQW